MRVISQIGHIDVDYESYIIVPSNAINNMNNPSMNNIDNYMNIPNNMTMEDYTKYIVIDSHNNMFITNGLDYELDRAFKRIEVKELKATAFKFPADEDL